MVRMWSRASFVSLAAVSAACGGVPDEPEKSVENALQLAKGDDDDQPLGRVFSAEIVKGQVRYLSPTDLPPSAAAASEEDALGLAAAAPFLAEGEVHPRLLADVERLERGNAAQRRALDERVDVVVTFKQRTKLPRFPEPNMREARDSAENQDALARAATLVSSVTAERGKSHDARRATLEQKHGVMVRERFWLIDGMLASVPLGKIRGLARHPDVQSIEYDKSDALPPSDNTIAEARAIMGADVFYGFTGGWIGMLDTGVRHTHTLFNSPTRIAVRSDCNTGTATSCGSVSTGDCSSGGHGTASANVISGNANWGDPYRGFSQIKIDSFKVYDNTVCGYNVTAGVRGFANAVALLDRVILANIQERASYNGATATAANSAFDAGAVVMGAAGNYGEDGASSVSSPGNATKVLGVGAVSVASLALQSYSGRGPTTDGRTKPDVTALTNLWAAGNASDGAGTPNPYGGTSCATPSATGAAAVARNFLRGNNSSVNPGQVYAFLIMAGQNFTAPATNNNDGAGLLKLYAGDVSIGWGSVSVAAGAFTDITVSRPSWPAGTNFFDVGIWWPQSSSHVNINLRLYRPSGSFIGSESSGSVFEKVRITSSAMQTGTWTIRITNAGFSTQTVYWARRYST